MILRPHEILRSARNKRELSSLETLILLESDDAILPELTELANALNEKLNGKIVSYVRAKHIHYTNICRAKCKLCSFYKVKGDRGGFSKDPEQIVSEIKRAAGINQVILQGGLNPDLNLKYHLKLIRTIKDAFPNLHVQAYSPTEILFMSKRSRIHYRQVLKMLKDAGLDSMSGDSANILNDKIRKKIASDKLKTNDWIEIIRSAHMLEIPTTATLLFGHIENEIYLSEHLDIVKRLQRESNFFTAFELIPFVPENTQLGGDKKIDKMVPIERILKMCTIVRLALTDLFRNLQLDWIKVGLENEVRALNAGVNDMGALSFDDYKVRPKFMQNKTSVTVAQVESAVAKIGKQALERKPYEIRKPKYNFYTTSFSCEPTYIRNY